MESKKSEKLNLLKF